MAFAAKSADIERLTGSQNLELLRSLAMVASCEFALT
jgi:hypothetical protein